MATDTPVDPGLARIQRWMLSCILDQGAAEEAIESPDAQSAIPATAARRVVLPSKTLQPLERLDIYRGMFLPRMEEALAVDYPALKHLLGADEFMRLVARYVEEYPSRSYTLNRLGDHLPEFIARLATDALPRKEFCEDLSRLELALTEVFDEVETPSLSGDAVRAVPQDAWENARLKPVAAYRLGEFRYPVSQYIGGVDKENPFPRLARKNSWVVAYRRDYSVHRLDLAAPAYALLSAIASGKTLGQAITSVITAKWRPVVTQSNLFDWFRDWMSEGLFQSVELT